MKVPVKIKKEIVTSWWIDNLIDSLIVAFLYLAISALVLQLPQSQLGSPVWPPAGIAVGALLARGRSRCWGIFLGAALNSFFVSKAPFLFAILAGFVPTIGALTSTTLILFFNKTNNFLNYVKNFVRFALATTFGGTILQALLGTLIVSSAGLITWDVYWKVAWGWWVGDAMGVLLFAPLVFVWWSRQSTITPVTNNKWSFRSNGKELFLCLSILVVTSYFTIIGNQPLEYFLLPPLLWSAFRFGSKITTLTVMFTAMVAAISTSYKFGSFYKISTEINSLIFLQLFMGVILITTLMVLVLAEENNRNSQELQEQVILKDKAYTQLDLINRDLEEIIETRTSELLEANREIKFLNEQLTAENYRMSSELAVTRRLQKMILPRTKELNTIKELDIVGFMEPADEVGGDYYDVLQQNGHIKIGIGDVTGHGLESGVIMIMLQTAIRTLLINGEKNPVKFLSTVNHTIYENLQRMNCEKSLSLILIDYHDRVLHLSGQHESVIVIRDSGDIEIIDTDALGFPIGLTDEISEFIFETAINLNLGDVVVLYTDGITEAENSTKELYGIDRLIHTISKFHRNSVDQIREAVITDIREFIGSSKVYDDITLVVMKRKI
ncbi:MULTISPECIES: SpoIIE family protein phosphatase [Pseudanabaena]|uniref:Protein serine/threonine phosphatase n=2 Tax=Pseudanabaena TaxID=1152 RepID=L8N744_9CYAN|nr:MULTISPECIES: SpoIIE family protein phosphatase [Pseudanabaena]ELS34053.1 protein serine/threonine phosphatase [Pseudanabaena biceps PCC 7429]MDG3493716.1 SpoIIE family protein phosphatase [Pseudanabaena catenata USMAC16]